MDIDSAAPVRLVGREGVVEVSRGPNGRRVVNAVTWGDAAFGLGWCVASDRPRQLDVLRRTTQGRLAEVAGRSALPSDMWHRRLNMAATARMGWERLPLEQQLLTEAFTSGVRSTESTSVIADWEPWDCISVAQILLSQLASDGADNRMVEVMRRTLPPPVVEFLLPTQDEFATDLDGSPMTAAIRQPPMEALRRLFSEHTGGAQGAPPRIVVNDSRAVGSNAWAISTGGHALLANDMHLPLTNPSSWYPISLVVGDREIAGATLPGLPLVVTGSHQRLAWGYTRLTADDADLKELPAVRHEIASAPVHSSQYRVRVETIAVLDSEPQELRVEDSVHGPVLSSLNGRAIAFSSSLTDPSALDFNAVGLYTADDVAAGVSVITRSGLPPVNAVLADAEGSVAWTVGGRLRSGRGTPRGLVTDPGVDLAPSEKPRLLKKSGYIVNANNCGNLAGQAGIGWNWFSGGRAQRIASLIATGEPSVEASGNIQSDVDASFYSYYRALALRWLPVGSPTTQALREEILAWQGTARADEIGLALLVSFHECLREAIFSALTGPAQHYDSEFTYCYHNHEPALRLVLGSLDSDFVPGPWKGPREFVLAQLVLARALLTARTGRRQPARWGAVNVFSPTHLFDQGEMKSGAPAVVELGGSMESVRVTAPDFGAAVRVVVAPSLGEGLIGIPGAIREGEERAFWAAVREWAVGSNGPLFSVRMNDR